MLTPAAILAVIIVLAVFAAVILAAWTARQPADDNGLRYEYQIDRARRATSNGRQ